MSRRAGACSVLVHEPPAAGRPCGKRQSQAPENAQVSAAGVWTAAKGAEAQLSGGPKLCLLLTASAFPRGTYLNAASAAAPRC